MRSRQTQLDSYSIYKDLLWVIIILIGSFTYIYWILPPELTSRLSGYIQVLTLCIFSITCILGVSSFKNQVEDRSRSLDLQYCNMSQSKVADVDRLFMGNPNLDRLYFDLYRMDPKIQNIAKLRGPIPVTPDILKYEHQATNVIIQKMADIFAMERFKHKYRTDDIEWINTFRGWMQSSILRSHWKFFKYECHPEFRDFVDTVLIQRNKFIK